MHAGVRLEFYLDRAMQMYEAGHIPRLSCAGGGAKFASGSGATCSGTRVSYLTSIPAQKLDLYWVGKEVEGIRPELRSDDGGACPELVEGTPVAPSLIENIAIAPS